MAMTNRNTRAIHTDAKRIKSNLARHAELMARHVTLGMSREAASKQAFKDMQRARA